MESFRSVVKALKDRYLPYHEGHRVWRRNDEDYNLELPPWLCQPYVRDSPEDHVSKVEAKRIQTESMLEKRSYKDQEGNEISHKRSKKLRRIARRPNKPVTPSKKRGSSLCEFCPNPRGSKCEYKMCRQCCRNKCFTENLDCKGHRNMTKTRRKMAIDYALQRKNSEVES